MSAAILNRTTPEVALSTLTGDTIPTEAHALLHQAGMLGWNVRTVPVSAAELTDDGVTGFELPKSAATVYTNPDDGASHAIGVVGRGYTPVQNEAMIPFLDALHNASGGAFTSAGFSPDHGSVFVGIRTPLTLEIGGYDKVGVSVRVTNAHDGTAAFRVTAALVRLVCTNGMTAGVPGTKSGVAVRHTAGVASALTEAHRSLGAIEAYAGAFKNRAESMMYQPVPDTTFEQIVADLMPVTAEDNPHSAAILNLRHSSETIGEEVRGSAWGAYQAATEYLDHYMPVRTRGDQHVARARRNMGSGAALLRSRLFRELATAR